MEVSNIFNPPDQQRFPLRVFFSTRRCASSRPSCGRKVVDRHPGPRSRQLQAHMCGRVYPHQLLVIIVLLPVLDGLDHVVHKIVLHSQVQLSRAGQKVPPTVSVVDVRLNPVDGTARKNKTMIPVTNLQHQSRCSSSEVVSSSQFHVGSPSEGRTTSCW